MATVDETRVAEILSDLLTPQRILEVVEELTEEEIRQFAWKLASDARCQSGAYWALWRPADRLARTIAEDEAEGNE